MDRQADNKIRYQQLFESLDPSTRKTKIICTLGPACWDTDMLVKMLDAGMNVARLDFSDGDHKTHAQSLENLREALKQRPDKSCAVLMDMKGPEICTGFLRDNKPIDIVQGQTLKIVTDFAIEGDANKIACSYKSLPKTVHVGSKIVIADGALTCDVTEIHDEFVQVVCKNSIRLGEKKSVNLPGSIIDMPSLTEKDEDDLLEFGIKFGVDFVAASFVRKKTDLDTIRDILGGKGSNIKIISKIENNEGLQNFEEILEVSDGILVARQQLGMEIPPEKVFIAQKWMAEKANLQSKPVIISTQVLDSMVKASRPNRAEASDVCNAVMDGADCIMLQNETAAGDYPINAVSILGKICAEAEKTINYRETFNTMKLYTPKPIHTSEAVAAAACQAVLDQKEITLIIVLSDTGKLARLVAKYRPEVNILACSLNSAAVRQMCSMRGVLGLKIPTFQGQDNIIQFLMQEAKNQKMAKVGAKIAVVHGSNEETVEESNILKILDVE